MPHCHHESAPSPLVGHDHVLKEFRVSLDHVQRDHFIDIHLRVPQLVQLQVHGEQVLPDRV